MDNAKPYFHPTKSPCAGLGPEGVDTLVVDDKAFGDTAEKYFPEENNGRGGLKDFNKGGAGALSGYDFTIGTSHVSLVKQNSTNLLHARFPGTLLSLDRPTFE